ncbi:MAG: flagellar biosynthetic protein FliQ [Planctomycetota bacterium]
MDENYIVNLGGEMFRLTALIAAPAMLVGMMVGIVMALFQAITSVQEQTLTMIPKIFAVALTLVLMMPWILHTLVSFTAEIFRSLGDAIY